jgi:hypothetical protein
MKVAAPGRKIGVKIGDTIVDRHIGRSFDRKLAASTIVAGTARAMGKRRKTPEKRRKK